MWLLLTIITLGLLTLVGFWIGSKAANKNRLSLEEREELAALRIMSRELMRFGIQQAAVGEPSGQIIVDEINKVQDVKIKGKR